MWLVVILLVAACLIVPLVSYGKDARMHDVLVTSDGNEVLAYVRISNWVTKDMESAIMTGVPMTVIFMIDFYQQKPGWLDKRLAQIRIKHSLKYDEVKKIFHFSSTGAKKSADFTDMESAKQAMAELDAVQLAYMNNLSQGVSYYVDVKAKLDEIRLPLHMEKLMFFVSLWDFETDWYHQPFIVQGRTVIMKRSGP
jgi:hypothetical protein